MSKEKEKVVEAAEPKAVEVVEEGKSQEVEFQELIEGLKRVSRAVGEIAADGEVNAKDFDSLVSLASDFDVLVDAFQGIDRAFPKGITRQFSAAALVGIFDMIDEFKAGKESK